MNCRTALMTLLDQVDYTARNCRVNEMVGAVLPEEIIILCREALAQPDEPHCPKCNDYMKCGNPSCGYDSSNPVLGSES
jgi:hypothetical protein